MTTDNKTLPADALAVMDELIDFEERHAEYEPRQNHEAREARAAFAELIQIATEFSDYVAVDHNDTSLMDRSDMWDRLGFAVSRVKGESA
ncbi:hypothetical protein AB9H29_12210 [Stenotrophomonas sepilia]|uniref:hypothetical protein n=1 Tax=Stenotrophomonas sepilia TaxID=2860290 RepID=UPI003558C0F9